MIDTRIVINNGDGTVGILTPSPSMFDPNSRDRALIPELNGKTDEEVLDWIITKDVPKDKSYRITTLDNIPFDRTFRNAWTDDNDTDTVDIDMDKAKVIQLDKFRELRKPILEQLDIESIKNLEENKSNEEVIAKKQELRDVTKIDLPDTAEELKDFIPKILAIEGNK